MGCDLHTVEAYVRGSILCIWKEAQSVDHDMPNYHSGRIFGVPFIAEIKAYS